MNKRKTKKGKKKLTFKERLKKCLEHCDWNFLAIFLFGLFCIVDIAFISSSISAILFLVAVNLLFVALFVIVMFSKKERKAKVVAGFVYLGNILVIDCCLLGSFSTFVLAEFIYNSILFLYILIDRMICKEVNPKSKEVCKNLDGLPMYILFTCCLFVFNYGYVDAWSFFLYCLIVAVIFTICVSVVLFVCFKEYVKQFLSKVYKKVLAVLAIFLFAFIYSIQFVNIINTSYDTSKQIKNCEIVDKKATTQRNYSILRLYVMIDGQKVEIVVSLDVYKSKEIGDELTVGYYTGNLNLPYYKSME